MGFLLALPEVARRTEQIGITAVERQHDAAGFAAGPNPREGAMPRGDKSSYSSKQKRQAREIEKGYERRGVSDRKSVV